MEEGHGRSLSAFRRLPIEFSKPWSVIDKGSSPLPFIPFSGHGWLLDCDDEESLEARICLAYQWENRHPIKDMLQVNQWKGNRLCWVEDNFYTQHTVSSQLLLWNLNSQKVLNKLLKPQFNHFWWALPCFTEWWGLLRPWMECLHGTAYWSFWPCQRHDPHQQNRTPVYSRPFGLDAVWIQANFRPLKEVSNLN